MVSQSQTDSWCAAITPSWLTRPATEVAPDLVGCVLVRQFPDGTLQRGMIVEVEAYGPGDPACHAYRKRTPRNAVMFGPAGFSYVYFIYGMYHCLNVVTDQDGVPSAVLLRALALEGSTNTEGRSPKAWARVAAGPGKLCRQLAIDKTHNERPLVTGEPLWLEGRSPEFQNALDCQQEKLVQTTRIGISQGADLPWRWYLQGSAAVSKTMT